MRELDARGIQVEFVDRNYQLFELPLGDGSKAPPIWTKLNNVVAKISIVTATKEEYLEGKKSGSIPPRNSYFILPITPPPSPDTILSKVDESDSFPLTQMSSDEDTD
jgi:hypothetical protein